MIDNINPLIAELFYEANRNGVAKAKFERSVFNLICRELSKINYKIDEPKFSIQLMCDEQVNIFIMKY